jgi:hypothetical protein
VLDDDCDEDGETAIISATKGGELKDTLVDPVVPSVALDHASTKDPADSCA